MGREIKRVDKDFDWYEKTKDKSTDYPKTWKGYLLDDNLLCFLCDGTGKNIKGGRCSLCYGERKIAPRVEPSWGYAYQIWENVSEGSPVSPAFEKPEELAKWMVENDTSITKGTSYEAWLKMIKEEGSSPSMVTNSKGLVSGMDLYEEKK